MFCHVTLKFKEINNNLREIKRLFELFKNYGVVQVCQTKCDESVLFWTSCKCLWTLYGAKTSQRKSQFSSWSTHRIQQPIPKLRNQVVCTNILTKFYKSSLFSSVWYKVIYNGFKTVTTTQIVHFVMKNLQMNLVFVYPAIVSLLPIMYLYCLILAKTETN